MIEILMIWWIKTSIWLQNPITTSEQMHHVIARPSEAIPPIHKYHPNNTQMPDKYHPNTQIPIKNNTNTTQIHKK